MTATVGRRDSDRVHGQYQDSGTPFAMKQSKFVRERIVCAVEPVDSDAAGLRGRGRGLRRGRPFVEPPSGTDIALQRASANLICLV